MQAYFIGIPSRRKIPLLAQHRILPPQPPQLLLRLRQLPIPREDIARGAPRSVLHLPGPPPQHIRPDVQLPADLRHTHPKLLPLAQQPHGFHLELCAKGTPLPAPTPFGLRHGPPPPRTLTGIMRCPSNRVNPTRDIGATDVEACARVFVTPMERSPTPVAS